ncbi:MAG: GNAT family N-acetyltransferase [Erysipelotrichaceae bacterium]|nr:GNAT family N-acetyltransferase [Erysipelotrichaceae bacterium]
MKLQKGMNSMLLKWKNVTVRNAEKEDACLLEKWWNDGEVMAHAGFPNGLGISRQEIEESLSEDSDLTRRRLMLEYDGIPIGEMNFRNKNDGRAEIGIKICEKQYQERGIGPVALSLLIKELFRMGYSSVILDTNLENRRAQHVYEKLGFVKTGIRMDSWRDQLGRLQSAVDYCLLPSDFIDFTREEGDMKMKQIERIMHYEQLMDEARKLLDDLSKKVDAVRRLDEAVKELSEYSGSREWKKDFEADEAGKLPADLKRGVLSEDGLYDLMDEYNELFSELENILSTEDSE